MKAVSRIPRPARRTKVKPHVDCATRYADSVVEGKIVAGPVVRAACARHLRDLETGRDRGLVWKPEAVERADGFFRDVLRLNGGEHEGRPFELHPSQQFIVGSLFGWHNEDGYRRFRVAYVEEAKGNGKSPLAAGVGLYMMTADHEPRAEVYAAATKKDQAMILFRDAVAMVDQSPALRARVQKLGGVMPWNLYHASSNSFFKAISSDDSQSGPRPHCALIDELHEHPDGNVVGKMRAGTKGRRQALQLEITNAGFDRTSICWDHHEYSRRVVDGLAEDDSWFGFITSLDEGDDWRDTLVWRKANPLLGVSITERYLQEQVREAVGMPSKQSLVKRLNFCVWVDAESPWIDGEVWRSRLSKVDREALRGKRCVAALDLSSKNDLTALVLTFPDEEPMRSIAFFWTPGDTLRDREERDRAPYRLWVERGHLMTTPGRAIDYAFVAAQVVKLMGEFEFNELVFDRWRVDDFIRELDDLDVTSALVELGTDADPTVRLTLRPYGQGFRDMGPAVDALENELFNGGLVVDDNPVMNMCAANAVLTMDPAGSRKFDKRSSVGRIDGVVALAMATRAAQLSRIVKSFWE